MTPYEKLCKDYKLPDEICLFPVINLDEIPDILNSYFKNFYLNPKYNLLTQSYF